MIGMILLRITEVKVMTKIIVVLRTIPSFFMYLFVFRNETLENRTKGIAPLTMPPMKRRCIYCQENVNFFFDIRRPMIPRR